MIRGIPRLALKPVLALSLLGACGGVGPGEAGVTDTIRFAVGMDVDQFNAQPGVARQSVKLNPREPGVVTIGEPHELIIEVNGRNLPFNGGGDNAFTYITNGIYRQDADSLTDKVGSALFDINRELITLPEAVDLASKACKSMRAAGLLPRDPGKFGTVTETVRRGPPKLVANEMELREAFASPDLGAIRAVFCTLEDDKHSFELQMSNSRRAIHRAEGGGREDDALTERWYRVKASFGQNVLLAAAKAKAPSTATPGGK